MVEQLCGDGRRGMGARVRLPFEAMTKCRPDFIFMSPCHVCAQNVRRMRSAHGQSDLDERNVGESEATTPERSPNTVPAVAE